MKHTHRWKTAVLTGAAAALVLGSSVGTSMSYFTTYVTAKGSKTVAVERTIPSIHEEFGDGGTKMVQIGNNGQRDCYVRVKLFIPLEQNQYTIQYNTEHWFYDSTSDYWYYTEVLTPNTTVPQEDIITIVPNLNPTDPSQKIKDDFNIVVEVESAPIIYVKDEANGDTVLHANGPTYEGWNLTPKQP